MAKGIYCIKNLVNGKVYIGLTKNLRTRKTSHFSTLRKGRHGNSHLQKAFEKYGEENFQYSIIEFTDNVEEREIFWINHFGGVESKMIYNQKTGGFSGYQFSSELKLQISTRQTGRKKSAETIARFIKSRTGIPMTDSHKQHLSNLYKGRPLTQETKDKISATKTGVKLSDAAKEKLKDRGNVPIIQYTLDGKRIKEFKSAKQAGIDLGFWKSDITQCCMGNRKTVKGFIFKYKQS